MKDRIKESLNLIYEFIRNPFDKPLDKLDDDKSLVIVASILSGFTVIVKTLNQSDNFYAPWMYLVFLLIGFLLTPLFGLLIVHFKGAIFHLYLKYIASPIIKEQLDDILKSKQIQTFTTIGLVVSSVPSLYYIGLLIAVIIEFFGLYRLFKIDLKVSIIIAIIYNAIWWGLFFLIAKGTAWI